MNINFLNGAAVDVAEDCNLEFARKNMLFAFDNIEIERTAEFDLPATPHNNALFQLARDPHYTGNKMRRRFPVQMQSSGVTKTGYLYITAYDGGVYKAVFVTGTLLGLKAIQEAGNLADLYPNDSYIIYPITGDPTPAETGITDIDVVNYKRDKNRLYPSINLTAVTTAALQSLGYGIELPTTDIYRVIPAKIEPMQPRPNVLKREWLSNLGDTQEHSPLLNNITAESMFSDLFYIEHTDITRRDYEGLHYGTINQFRAATNLKIHFPRTLPAGTFLVEFDDTASTEYTTGVKFYGGYELVYYYPSSESFDLRTKGTPLAGREVSISKGEKFLLVYIGNDFYRTYDGANYGQSFVPQRKGPFEPERDWYNIDVKIEITGEADEFNRQPIFLKDNLPGITIVDAAKTIAALTGTLLVWDEEAGRIRFETADVATWEKKDITPYTISEGELRRTFGDYAQNNTIGFDTADNVAAADVLSLDYAIDNETIEQANELYKIPFSEGGLLITDDERNLYFDDNRFDDSNKDGIAIAAGNTADYMERVSLPANATIVNVCGQSTTINVTFRCPLILFDAITDKTLLHYRGIDYVWTELHYNNDVVAATLAKVVIPHAAPPVVTHTLRVIDRYVNADETYEESVREEVELEQGAAYSFEALTPLNGYDVTSPELSGIVTQDEDIVFEYPTKTIYINSLSPKPDGVNYSVDYYTEIYMFFNNLAGGKLAVPVAGSVYRKTGQYSAEDIVNTCRFALLYANYADTATEITEDISYRYRCKAAGMGINDIDYHFNNDNAVFDVIVQVNNFTFQSGVIWCAFIAFNNSLTTFPTITTTYYQNN